MADEDLLGLFGTPSVPPPAASTTPAQRKARPPSLMMSPQMQHLRSDGLAGMLTPTSAAYQAHQAGRPPMTPRGNAFRRIGQLYAEGRITSAEKGSLKDAVISGNNISTHLDDLLALPKADRAGASALVAKATGAATAAAAAANPFDDPAPSFSPFSAKQRKALTHDDRADSFSNLRSSTTAAADDFWDDSKPEDDPFGLESAASAPAPSAAKPAAKPTAKPAKPAGRRDRTSSDAASAGAGAGAGAGTGARDDAAGTTRAADEPDFDAKLAGVLMMREGHLVLKKWRPRYVVLENGELFVYGSRREYENGDYPSFALTLTHSMGLSDMKVANKKRERIFYRHVYEMKPGAAIAGSKGKHRVWKWGATTMPEFERWTKAIRGVVERKARVFRHREKEALALDTAMAPMDIMSQARASPRRRARRRASTVEATSFDGGHEALTLSVHLLDGTVVRPVVHKGATVRDVLLVVRRKLGLEADADFSLFMRDATHGDDHFTCLPDSMLAEEADACALSDAKSLVYKRRIVLPLPETGAVTDEGKDVDTEELEATSVDAAAHKLAYADAVFNTLAGNFLMDVEDAVNLAALKLVSDDGAAVPPADGLARRVTELFSGEVVLEAVLGKHQSVEQLMEAVVKRRAELGDLSAFDAQRSFVQSVRSLPEFGSTFFRAALLRYFAGDLEAPGVESAAAADGDLPMWLQGCTGTDKRHPPPSVDVLVAINATGVFTRLAPPTHADMDEVLRSMKAAGGSGRRPSTAAVHFGAPSNWIAHHVQFVEVWGVKKTRPVFTYRVRELEKLMLVELRTPQFQEIANVLHMYVFNLLAQREGKAHLNARPGTTDYGSTARAEAEAAAAAEAVAKYKLPEGWSEIKDPITGKVCYWNSITKETVFSRPGAV